MTISLDPDRRVQVEAGMAPGKKHPDPLRADLPSVQQHHKFYPSHLDMRKSSPSLSKQQNPGPPRGAPGPGFSAGTAGNNPGGSTASGRSISSTTRTVGLMGSMMSPTAGRNWTPTPTICDRRPACSRRDFRTWRYYPFSCGWTGGPKRSPDGDRGSRRSSSSTHPMQYACAFTSKVSPASLRDRAGSIGLSFLLK